MKTLKPPILVLVGFVVLQACGGTKMSVVKPSTALARKISTIAIAPGSGVLGEAVGVELFNRGITIVDANEATVILGRAGLKEYEFTTYNGVAALRAKGIGAVLAAKSVDANDGTPESAVVRLTETEGGRLIAAVTWQNAWGGQRGSIVDRVMRANLSDAANEIATELVKRLGL
ncbi:MAG: hypothetical protein RX318_07695 [bacterium]|nr:hypothetical protein [bacterium]